MGIEYIHTYILQLNDTSYSLSMSVPIFITLIKEITVKYRRVIYSPNAYQFSGIMGIKNITHIEYHVDA